ncbi:HIT family protein [Kribbella antibiotica]|uniref:HIT family protein n=1 Tax=Kribbella antibiotica TaxID=190195 RepID=A0A4R4YXC4_9ACTN|nr:HIT family protein [Kribbella antibiotica]TDD50073.1 HIT family protein [Kribbella antibiotica]
MTFQWPTNWDRLMSGEDCDFCKGMGHDRNKWGARIYLGEYVDAYLQSADIQPGYTLIIWKSRHVVEPVELSDDESAGYWLGTMRVARALMEYYVPLKMNYETLGNTSPHLHTHLLPRYVEDPRPGQPFPLLAQKGNEQQIPEERFLTEVKGLREILM